MSRGVLVNDDGDYYIGEMVEGMMQGEGVQQIGTLRYQGTFHQNNKHGHGT